MAKLKERGLIVSCQAVKGEPLYGLHMMGHFARAAVLGGAAGIRANYVEDINEITAEVDGLLTTKCSVIALDATKRSRPNGEKLEDLIKYIRENAPEVEIMADCSNYEEAKRADELGFDYIGTTLRGYTEYTKGIAIPDCELLREMTSTLHAHIIAEGGIWEVGQLKNVLDTGVYAVVIGSAITRPMDITKHFMKAFGE